MRLPVVALPSLFWLLVSTCQANPWQVHEPPAAGLSALNETLWRRVRLPGATGNDAPPPADKLFLFGPDNLIGGCSSKKSDIEAWLVEIRLVHNAIETMYSTVTTPNVGKMWDSFFGIMLHRNPDTLQVEIDPGSVDRWRDIGTRTKIGFGTLEDLLISSADHIARVSMFLDGHGLREPVVPGEVPRVFCSPEAGEVVEWNSILKDKDGKNVEKSTDPVTGERQYMTLIEAYPSRRNQIPYWMNSFNGYWFEKLKLGKEISLFPEKSRLAATGRPLLPNSEALSVKLARANRAILICPDAWTRKIGQAHGQPSLSRLVSWANYPKGDGSQRESLVNMIPMSMTLYHELIHLTDYDRQTAEPDYYVLSKILKLKDSIKMEDMEAVPHNPETYFYFGIAAYIYLNPPESKSRIMHVSETSATEDAVWEEMEKEYQRGS